MPHNYDFLWKGLLEWVFDDLLRFLYPHADHVFDLRTQLGFLDKELAALSPEPDGQSTLRVVDKLIKVKLKKVSDHALVHLEVQGQTKTKDRPLFGARMFRYFQLIQVHYCEPLASIAIFTGTEGHLMPREYCYSFLDSRLRYRYAAINIRDYSDEELIASNNCFAWAMYIAKQAPLCKRDRQERLLEKKWLVFQKLFENGLFEDRKLQAVLTFMNHYLPFEDKEIIRIFDERVDALTGKKNTMDIFEQIAEMKKEEGLQVGREEGIQIGKEKGIQIAKEEGARSLLLNTEFSIAKIAELMKVPVGLVRKLSKEVRIK